MPGSVAQTQQSAVARQRRKQPLELGNRGSVKLRIFESKGDKAAQVRLVPITVSRGSGGTGKRTLKGDQGERDFSPPLTGRKPFELVERKHQYACFIRSNRSSLDIARGM